MAAHTALGLGLAAQRAQSSRSESQGGIEGLQRLPGLPDREIELPNYSRAGTIGPGVKGSFSSLSFPSAATVNAAIAAASSPIPAERQAGADFSSASVWVAQ
ncbi:hypothetical protein IAG41_00305 [Sphingomonas sp. JC676]|uniref:hypothetical protein n=1 Tax=Sphingomonas sp. JC676 TaxID=2768065 RepID=UPI00165857E6|nr:hypothetical protein [Sphingomonas sp. JC676]MBC9030822.1 hypothetical protein [Sphingomonas sp. JC676]